MTRKPLAAALIAASVSFASMGVAQEVPTSEAPSPGGYRVDENASGFQLVTHGVWAPAATGREPARPAVATGNAPFQPSIARSATTSGYSLLAIGLMNSIMFPTIFSLACEKLGARTADGSGIINVAIFGGAVIPLMTGGIADMTGSLATSLILPALCYAIIAFFGWYSGRPIHEKQA